MMFSDTWDDVKRRKNDFVSKTNIFSFLSVHAAPLKPLDMALERLLTGITDIKS